MPELRLLSYNVRSLRDDRASVAAVIRACRPDVVAVQEAPRSLRWRSKRAALARTSGLVVATADREGVSGPDAAGEVPLEWVGSAASDNRGDWHRTEDWAKRGLGPIDRGPGRSCFCSTRS